METRRKRICQHIPGFERQRCFFCSRRTLGSLSPCRGLLFPQLSSLLHLSDDLCVSRRSLSPFSFPSHACERTYLFCAIRPEVTYHKYTFATLGFAKNASVVKLKPKMTTVKATPAEKKLMEELEQMKVCMVCVSYCARLAGHSWVSSVTRAADQSRQND